MYHPRFASSPLLPLIIQGIHVPRISRRSVECAYELVTWTTVRDDAREHVGWSWMKMVCGGFPGEADVEDGQLHAGKKV